ncbi:phenazine biosynthesis protein [Ferrigenium kumadai]|uniref:Phenazine biosynthesis protein n=1 Tax=Ferrigenium kumadai TaxID=1682490 RepID=A0AAN1SXY0_9PROT|nr:PhzF family phenazine biosynthesis protein [Ferrigenium kumadai]BBI99013.1 phenazine biosynthesis protein [Ferrigenium kumadai]
MGKPRFFITDVFTSQRYGGNQLATFVDCESLSDREMQQIAKEINFSETTFITSRQPRDGGFDVRIFTPNAEVEFAGHPTLGTAHIIRNRLRLTEAIEVALNLRVGKIPVAFAETPAKASLLWMKQMPPTFGKRLDAGALARVLGVEPSDIDQDFPIVEVSTGFPAVVVPLKNLDALRRARIDKEAYFALVNDAWAKLILVFSTEGYEAAQNVSVRVFADYYGIPEDAATGSANGCLAAYLACNKVFGSPSIDVLAGQGYEMGRPSTLALRANETDGEIEVSVGGSVVDVAEGVWG